MKRLHSPLPLQKERYQAGVIIPSYREGGGILTVLHSLSVQEGVDLESVLVMVVINNSRDAARHVLESNRLTQDVVEGLWSSTPPQLLVKEWLKDKYYFQQYVLFQKIARKRMHLVFLDAWSGSNAPQHCNVGKARDWGGKAAYPYVAPGQPFVFTDADCMLDKNYLQSLLGLYQNPSVLAATGYAQSFPDKNDPLQSHVQTMDIIRQSMEELQERLLKAQGMHSLPQGGEAVFMPGANMTMRKEVFRKLGGIAHVAGAEDTLFSLGVIRSGAEIVYDPKLCVHTFCRVSDRTHPDNGYGQRLGRIAEQADDVSGMRIYSLEWQKAKRLLLHHLDSLHTRCVGRDDWIRECGKPLLPEEMEPLDAEEAVLLWEDMQLAPRLVPSKNDMFVSHVHRILAQRHPETTLEKGIADMEQIMDDATPAHRAARMYINSVVTDMPDVPDASDIRPGTPQQQELGTWSRRVASLDPLLEAHALFGELQNSLGQLGEELPALFPECTYQAQELLKNIRIRAIHYMSLNAAATWLRSHLSTFYVMDPRALHVFHSITTLLQYAADEDEKLGGLHKELRTLLLGIGRQGGATVSIKDIFTPGMEAYLECNAKLHVWSASLWAFADAWRKDCEKCAENMEKAQSTDVGTVV